MLCRRSATRLRLLLNFSHSISWRRNPFWPRRWAVQKQNILEAHAMSDIYERGQHTTQRVQARRLRRRFQHGGRLAVLLGAALRPASAAALSADAPQSAKEPSAYARPRAKSEGRAARAQQPQDAPRQAPREVRGRLNRGCRFGACRHQHLPLKNESVSGGDAAHDLFSSMAKATLMRHLNLSTWTRASGSSRRDAVFTSTRRWRCSP